MDEQRRRRATSFGEVAEAYDANRPGYPSELFDDLLELVPGAGDVVEIGPGTGKATVALVQRGLRVTGVEPDPAMAAIATAKLDGRPGCAMVIARFEDWPGAPASADLVVAAQSFHWLDPDVAVPKIAHVLRRPGALAMLGNTRSPIDSPLGAELDAVYEREAPQLVRESVMANWHGGPAERGRFSDAVEAGGFDRLDLRSYDWTQRYTAAEYTNLLRTHSDHRALSPEVLDALLAGLAAVIDANGGSFDFAYRAFLGLARVG